MSRPICAGCGGTGKVPGRRDSAGNAAAWAICPHCRGAGLLVEAPSESPAERWSACSAFGLAAYWVGDAASDPRFTENLIRWSENRNGIAKGVGIDRIRAASGTGWVRGIAAVLMDGVR